MFQIVYVIYEPWMLMLFALRLYNKLQHSIGIVGDKAILFQQPFCTRSFCVRFHSNRFCLILPQRIYQFVQHLRGNSIMSEPFNDCDAFDRKNGRFCNKAVN